MKACNVMELKGHASFITSDLEEGLWPVAFLVRWESRIINRWVDMPTDLDVRDKGIRPYRESNRDYKLTSQSVLWTLLSVPQEQVLQICGRLDFKVQITGGPAMSPTFMSLSAVPLSADCTQLTLSDKPQITQQLPVGRAD